MSGPAIAVTRFHGIFIASAPGTDEATSVLISQKHRGGAWSFPSVHWKGSAANPAEEATSIAAQCLQETGGVSTLSKALGCSPHLMLEPVEWPPGPHRAPDNKLRCKDIWGSSCFYVFMLVDGAELLEDLTWRSAAGSLSRWASIEEELKGRSLSDRDRTLLRRALEAAEKALKTKSENARGVAAAGGRSPTAASASPEADHRGQAGLGVSSSQAVGASPKLRPTPKWRAGRGSVSPTSRSGQAGLGVQSPQAVGAGQAKGSSRGGRGEPELAKLCEYFERGHCSRGDKCKFAHGAEELEAVMARRREARGQDLPGGLEGLARARRPGRNPYVTEERPDDDEEALIIGPLNPNVAVKNIFDALEWELDYDDVVAVLIGEQNDPDWALAEDQRGAYAKVWFRTATIAQRALSLLQGRQLFRHWYWYRRISLVSVAGLRNRLCGGLSDQQLDASARSSRPSTSGQLLVEGELRSAADGNLRRLRGNAQREDLRIENDAVRAQVEQVVAAVDTLKDRREGAAKAAAAKAKGGGLAAKWRSSRFKRIASTIARGSRGAGGHSIGTLLQAEKSWMRVRNSRAKKKEGGDGRGLGGASPQARRASASSGSGGRGLGGASPQARRAPASSAGSSGGKGSGEAGVEIPAGRTSENAVYDFEELEDLYRNVGAEKLTLGAGAWQCSCGRWNLNRAEFCSQVGKDAPCRKARPADVKVLQPRLAPSNYRVRSDGQRRKESVSTRRQRRQNRRRAEGAVRAREAEVSGWTCRRCGARNLKDRLVCFSCMKRRTAAEAAADAVAATEVEADIEEQPQDDAEIEGLAQDGYEILDDTEGPAPGFPAGGVKRPGSAADRGERGDRGGKVRRAKSFDPTTGSDGNSPYAHTVWSIVVAGGSAVTSFYGLSAVVSVWAVR